MDSDDIMEFVIGIGITSSSTIEEIEEILAKIPDFGHNFHLIQWFFGLNPHTRAMEIYDYINKDNDDILWITSCVNY